MTETRLQRVLDRALLALDDDGEPPSRALAQRQPGLGIHDFLSTKRAALVARSHPGLVHRPTRRRGLPDLVDPSSLDLLERLQAVGHELARGGAAELVQRVREHGARQRARVLELGLSDEPEPEG